MHFHYRVLDIFDVFVLLRHDLVTLTFDFLKLRVCHVLLLSDTQTNFYYLMTIGYWVTSTEYLITFPLFETVTAHAPFHVTSNWGKNSPHFWNPWPQFASSLCHFHGATTNIKPCYRQKIAFSRFDGYKVYCACAVSRDLCIVGRSKAHVTIIWPRIAYSLYNFYAAMMTIKSSLYYSIPMLKRFLVGKNSPVKIAPRNGGFVDILRSKYKIWSSWPPKGISLPGNTSFDVFRVNIRPGV